MRLRDRVRYAFWCAVGTHGHLPQCRTQTISFVGREQGSANIGWRCAPGCPAMARDVARAAALIELRRRWFGRG